MCTSKYNHLKESEKLHRLVELFHLIHTSSLRDLDLDSCKEYSELLDAYIFGNSRFTSYPIDPDARRAKVEKFIVAQASGLFDKPPTKPKNEDPNIFDAPAYVPGRG